MQYGADPYIRNKVSNKPVGYRKTDIVTGRHSGRQVDIVIDRQADRQVGRRTDIVIGRQT